MPAVFEISAEGGKMNRIGILLLGILMPLSSMAADFEAERKFDRFKNETTIAAPNGSDYVAQGRNSGDPTLQMRAIYKGEGVNGVPVLSMGIMLATRYGQFRDCTEMIILADGKRLEFKKVVPLASLREGDVTSIFSTPITRPMVEALARAEKVEGSFCGREFSVGSDWRASWKTMFDR